MATTTYIAASTRALAEEMARDPARLGARRVIRPRGRLRPVQGPAGALQARRASPIRPFPRPASWARRWARRSPARGRWSRCASRTSRLCATDELNQPGGEGALQMFGGQARVPLVARQPIGMWRSSAAQHSQSLESLVRPRAGTRRRRAFDAGRQSRAPEERDPRRRPGGVSRAQGAVAAGRRGSRRRAPRRDRRRRRRPGRGATSRFVTWSAMRQPCLAAAGTLAQTGIEAEVIDLRTLWPWDRDRVLASVEKDRPAPRRARGGDGSGLRRRDRGLTLPSTCIIDLSAPVRRLGAPRNPHRPTRLPSRTRRG